MNEKEIGEIRRRFRPDKGNISRICGCYVNEKGEVLSEFSQSLGLLSQTEAEELLAILRKTLSGTAGQNLIDIEFATKQVLEGEEHRLLTAVRDSCLEDDAAVRELCRRIIPAVTLGGNYLILLACDKYDVPFYSKDGRRQDGSSEVFSYFLCSVCPVKPTKPALSYYAHENTFRSLAADWVIAAPEMGFLFPAFDDRSANLYDALFYTRDIAEGHPEFIDAVFKADSPMPAAAQRQTFQAILGETVAEDCSMEVVRSVHGRLTDMMEEHKANKEKDPLVISRQTVTGVLQSCGVSESHVTAFEEQYDTEFGADAQIPPRNVLDTKRLEVRTPDVTIRVNPERSDLVETRCIDGVGYILIRADGGVEVNGVNICISD